MSERFIGRGWAFPLRVGPTGGIALVEREREIEEAIRLVLGTAPGERPMRPEFGCGIHDYVFAPGDGATAGRIAQHAARRPVAGPRGRQSADEDLARGGRGGVRQDHVGRARGRVRRHRA
ncbi:GPW/gp25 family protein, partial [Streptomyces tricolor]|uniref:GPW/gp25 family protein n=1 Tax=Streptomyces tricolor TaxID=68277 RepID=UPI001FCA211C